MGIAIIGAVAIIGAGCATRQAGHMIVLKNCATCNVTVYGQDIDAALDKTVDAAAVTAAVDANAAASQQGPAAAHKDGAIALTQDTEKGNGDR